MRVKVNEGKKIDTQKNVNKTRGAVKSNRLLSAILMIVSICMCALFVKANLGVFPSLASNFDVKVLVTLLVQVVVIPGAIFALSYMFSGIANKHAYKDNTERVDETLRFEENFFQYAVRIVNNKTKYKDNERFVYKVNYSDIENIEFDEKLGMYKIRCKYNSAFVNDFKEDFILENTEETFDDVLVLYDYFNPTIKQCFKDHGIKVS